MDIREILQALSVERADDKVLLTGEETGLDVDMLVATMRSFGSVSNIGQGEFYFYGDERPEVFICRITLVTEVLPENELPLCMQLAVDDFDIPFGTFAYDSGEQSVIYYLQVPIAASLDDEEIIAESNLCISLALSFSEGYAAMYDNLAKRREI